MSDDPLREAARALKASASAQPAHADATRARIMTTLRRHRARRLSIIRAAIPLAAVLVGSIAWAAATGRLAASFRAIVPALHGQPAASEASPPAPLKLTARPSEVAAPLDPAPPAAVPPPAPAPSSETLPINPAPTAAKVVSAAPAAQPPPLGASAAAPTAASPDEIALYQTAHRIHFVDRNPTAALAAWDTYLRAAPRGRFAVEAQYNRALCLVRVGRTAEAQKVLSGFARGAYGGYRQAEAQNLLDAMGSPAP